MKLLTVLFSALLACPSFQHSPTLESAGPGEAGMTAERLERVKAAVDASIARGEVPGAVVLVARGGLVVYRQAFGNREVEPGLKPMTVDTVFDMASLTKTVATATSMMILVERGKVSLTDAVSLYIPEFGRMGKETITVEQLLTHRAGLPPDDDISDYIGVTANPMQNIYNLKPVYPPGSKFVYSDVGYIVAAEIIRRVTGVPLNQFAEENIFKPLGMNDTKFLPFPAPYGKDRGQAQPAVDKGYLDRVAATQLRDGHWMHGEVHDPRSWALGGVAGHAGLFSTAGDLAIFCQMVLNGGEYQG
ncbi:MAG: serine hydrolase domain-containing protein, partial [Blastocatellia bacterium]